MVGQWCMGKTVQPKSKRQESGHQDLADEQNGCGLCVRRGGEPLLSRKVTYSDL